jgi:pectate lyase
MACDSTTGGAGGTTTTVSDFAAFSAAAKGDAKKIIIVSGSISGTGSVKIGANTSVLGKSGACMISASDATLGHRFADELC